MKVIYYSNKATYTAYAMAAIHLGIYKEETLPCLDDILRQWELCFIYGHQRGNLIYMGLDDKFREIYIIGCGNHGKMVKKAYNAFNTIYGIEEDAHYIMASRRESMARMLVNLSLQFPSIEPIARKLFVVGFKRVYPLWQKRVQREKQKLMEGIEL